MRTLFNLVVSGVVALSALPAWADGIKPPDQRTGEYTQPAAGTLDCYAQAERAPQRSLPESVDGRVFAPLGLPCDVKRFAVAVGHNGGLRRVYGPRESCEYLKPGEVACPEFYDAELDPVLKNLEEFAARKDSSGHQLTDDIRILIYAHGGMVSHQKAVRSAEQAAPWMINDGYFPIFLIWNSDFTSAYGDYLCCVSDGEQLNVARTFFAPARFAGDLVGGLGRTLENYGQQQVRSVNMQISAARPPYFLCAPQKRGDPVECRYRRIAPPGAATGEDNVIYPAFETLDDMNDRSSTSAQQRFLYASLLGVRGVTTIGAEGGARSWDNMVRRTRLGFSGVVPPGAQEPPDNPSTWPRCESAQSTPMLYGGFGQFFARLSRLLGPDGKIGGRTVRITFAGHSMGAIVGNELTRLFPCLPYEHILYMAGATTIRDTQASLVPIMRARANVRFTSLMLHPLSESRELYAGGIAPQGSLLEWIDEMFEGPRSIDERMLGKWLNLAAAKPSFPADLQERITFRIFPVQDTLVNPGECNPAATNTPEARGTIRKKDSGDLGSRFRRCHPIAHGEFDDYTFWRARYQQGPFAGVAGTAAETD